MKIAGKLPALQQNMKKRDVALAVAGGVGAAIAIKLLTRPATVDWDDVKDVVAHSDKSHFVSVDGMRVHYQEFGAATDPPILLIHGYTASAYVWRSSAPMLAEEGFRVIAPDLIGFGYSEKPRWFEYSIAAQSRMISRFMDRIGIGRANLVGSSYGGAIAATIALQEPERVEKLILVDSVINDDLKNHPIMKLASLPGLGEVITPFVADSRTYLKARMHGTLAPANHHLIDEDRVESVLRPLRAADGHHSLLATSRNWSANHVERDAHLITQPTLLVWGEEDSVTPLDDGYTLRDSIPGSRLVVIKDCGHVPQEERSDLFSKIVGEFCVTG